MRRNNQKVCHFVYKTVEEKGYNLTEKPCYLRKKFLTFIVRSGHKHNM
jgi:hypothetical protein